MKAKNVLFGILLSFLFISTTSAYEVSRKEKKSFKMKPGGQVIVVANEGYVRVTSWDKQEVLLKLTKRAWGRSRRRAEDRLEEIEVQIDHNGNRLSVREVDRHGRRDFHFFDIFNPDRWREGWRETQVDFDLTVPRRINLRLETDEGDVEVTETEGDISIEVDEGDVQLERVTSNNIKIEVDEGQVSCYRVSAKNKDQGRISVDTDEGRIRFDEGEFGRAEIASDEGDVIINDIKMLTGYVHTDEGDIELEAQIYANGRFRLSSDEGDIFIVLPDDSNLRVNLETEEGHIRTDFPLSIEKEEEGQRGRGTIGRDKARLDVYTEEGDIILEKR